MVDVPVIFGTSASGMSLELYHYATPLLSGFYLTSLKEIMILACIQKVLGSNLGPGTGYTD
jgi:hypothetical protein